MVQSAERLGFKLKATQQAQAASRRVTSPGEFMLRTALWPPIRGILLQSIDIRFDE